jgi:metal-responsive CopG/Arc/MetJ family transcriptional regulator
MPIVSTSVDSETYSKLLEIAKSRGVKLSEVVREALESYVKASTTGSGSTSSAKASEPLRTLDERVRDIEEKLRIIEFMHLGATDINKAIQVYEGDSEEGRKTLEEVRQKGKLISRSEGGGIDVEVYEV